MGTETQNLQHEIKTLIKQVGWSQNQLAEMLYVVAHEVDNDKELEQFKGRFKKELTRSTTKPEKLSRYLDLMLEDDRFQKLGLIRPKYVPNAKLSKEMQRAMQEISKEISLEDGESKS